MTKPIEQYTTDELSTKIKAIKAEREKTESALKRYEEELKRRKQQVPLGIPLEDKILAYHFGVYELGFTSAESRSIFYKRFKNYIEALQKLAKGEQIDIKVLLPLMRNGYVAMDKSCNWYWYSEKPQQDLDEWTRSSGLVERLSTSTFNIKPVSDWKNSLMECGI